MLFSEYLICNVDYTGTTVPQIFQCKIFVIVYSSKSSLRYYEINHRLSLLTLEMIICRVICLFYYDKFNRNLSEYIIDLSHLKKK